MPRCSLPGNSARRTSSRASSPWRPTGRGTAAVERAYLHACLSILDGRDAATRQALGESLCEVLAGAVAGGGEEGVQVSVEVREMERASYAKRVVARQR